MSNILITGASGVIGFPLLLRFLSRGYNITATFHTSKDFILSNCPKEFLSQLSLVLYDDLLNAPLSSEPFDEIWHFATYGQPILALNNYSQTIQLNVTDLSKLVNFLSPTGRFFYASTSEMYGSSIDSNESTIPASDPLSKRAIYTESKRLGEAIINTLLPSRSTILRLCLIYSSFAKFNDTRVMFQFIQKAFYNKSIDLLDTGKALRQYCYITDALNMLEFIQQYSRSHPDQCSGVWNVANPHSTSIYELANVISRYLEVPLSIPSSDRSTVLDALDRVSVLPERFLNLNTNYVFSSLDSSLPFVIDEYIKTLTLSNK